MSKSKKQKKFPEYLFVSIEEEGTDDEFFIASEKASGLVNEDGPTRVATYKLEGVAFLSKRLVSAPERG